MNSFPHIFCFIEEHRDLIFHEQSQDLARELPLAAFALLLHKQQQCAPAACIDPYSPWRNNNAWRLNEPHIHRLQLHCHQADHVVNVEQRGAQYRLSIGGQETLIEGRPK